jgi:hypothetical protein
MEVFLWAMVVVLAASSVGKLVWIATGKFPQRTPVLETWDVAVNVVLLIWACVLLARY